MTNLSAVLHNLLDAIDGGDMDEIKAAAKLARFAAPTPDTEDSGGGLLPAEFAAIPEGKWYVYDADDSASWPKRIILCESEEEADMLWQKLDQLNGNWYARQWEAAGTLPDPPKLTTEEEVRANA